MEVPEFVALSQFTVANGMEESVRAAFIARPHEVDQAPGYLRMQVWRPADQPEVFWLVTWWRDAESFKQWHHSHSYRQSHAHIPKGLKLIPGRQSIDHFEVVAE